MHIQTNAGDLRTAIALCARVTERRNTIPILSYARLVVGEKAAELTATNLNMNIQLALPCVVKNAGEIAIPVFQLVKLLALMPSETQLDLMSGEGGGLDIRAPFGRYIVSSLPVKGFPTIELGEAEVLVMGDPTQLRKAIGRAIAYVSTEETRYYLMGVCLDFIDDEGLAVATDGRRLIRVPLGVTHKPKNTAYIVPTAAARLLRDLPITEIRLGDAKFQAEFPGGSLRSKLINGNYPDWRRVVPKDQTGIFSLDPDAVLPSLRRLVALQSKSGPMVALSVAPDGSAAVGRFAPDETGTEIFEVDVQHLTEPTSITINAGYLIALLRGFGSPVQIGLRGAKDPILFTGEDAVAVIMPMPDSNWGEKTMALLSPRMKRAA